MDRKEWEKAKKELAAGTSGLNGIPTPILNPVCAAAGDERYADGDVEGGPRAGGEATPPGTPPLPGLASPALPAPRTPSRDDARNTPPNPEVPGGGEAAFDPGIDHGSHCGHCFKEGCAHCGGSLGGVGKGEARWAKLAVKETSLLDEAACC